MAALKHKGLVHQAYFVGTWSCIRTSCDLQWEDKRRHMLDAKNIPLTCLTCIALAPDDPYAWLAGERW